MDALGNYPLQPKYEPVWDALEEFTVPKRTLGNPARTAPIHRAVAIGRAAAQHALDSRQELAWLIGFGDVIVGAGPLTLHQADQARADFAAKCISLICDAHVIPFPELQQR
jgi:hypothetical protein